MLDLAGAMALILISWGVLAALLVGLGLRLQAFWLPQGQGVNGERVWMAFWLGFAFVIGLLQFWNLFWPVDWDVLTVLLICGGAGLAWKWRQLSTWARAGVTAHPRVTGLSLLGAIWLANRAIGPPVGDSGGYHLAVIRWMTSYPVVPGLANLQERFAFNNASLLWPALLEHGFWYGRSSHLANGLLLLAMGLRALWAGAACLRADAQPDAANVFTALLLTPVIASAVTLQELRLSSPDPDTTAALVLLAGATGLVALLGSTGPTTQRRWNALIFCTVMFVLALCIKTSTAGFAIPALGLTWLVTARASDERRIPTGRAALGMSAIAAILLIPWLIRGVILSGYPFFPAPWLGFPVDWRLPASRFMQYKTIRENFMPPVAWQMVKAGRPWPVAWFIWQTTRCPELVVFPAILCVGAAFYDWRAKAWSRPAAHLLWLLVPALGGILLWLATAPAPRFAYPFLWTAAAALLSAAYFAFVAKHPRDHRLLLGVIWLAIVFMPLAHRLAAWAATGNTENMIATLWLPPGPDRGLDPTPPAQVHKLVTNSGLTVYFPDDSNMLWDAPLPGTTDFIPQLELRQPPDLASGFKIAHTK